MLLGCPTNIVAAAAAAVFQCKTKLTRARARVCVCVSVCVCVCVCARQPDRRRQTGRQADASGLHSAAADLTKMRGSRSLSPGISRN